MRTIKKLLITVGTATLLLSSQVSACTFKWHHYGDEQVKSIINDSIGSHINAEYCSKANKNYEIVIQTNSYQLEDMCIGHAIVSTRKKGSTTLPTITTSTVFTNKDCQTKNQARQLASKAALDATDDMMANLNTYINK